ncbi:MAG: M20 family metallopeptidase [Ruminococcaceae bacterium]|nr:M20 family metallopeptidase [Oscillospiraceae bacterium]
MLKPLLDRIEQGQEELFDLLGRLIRINSENFGSHGNEKACALFIRDYCRALGLETELYSPLEAPGMTSHPDYWPGRNLEERYNVTARWTGIDNSDELMLAAHSDTVPIGDPSAWSFDPLGGEQRDGKILGRGACDDKYAIATTLFLLKQLKALGFQPRSNLLFTAYSDEEFGGSNGALAACLKYPSRRLVNLDCKNFEIWHSAAGGQVANLMLTSDTPLDSCGSMARALPAVLDAIDAFGARRKAELAANPFYAGTNIPDTALRYMTVQAGNEGNDLNQARVQFVFYTDKTKEAIEIEYDQMVDDLRRQLADQGIDQVRLQPVTRFFHYIYTPKDNPSITAMAKAARTVSGRELKVCGSCLSDLSIFLKYGSPLAYGFGIGRDFDAVGGAHQTDEYIETADLLEYAQTVGTYLVKTMS